MEHKGYMRHYNAETDSLCTDPECCYFDLSVLERSTAKYDWFTHWAGPEIDIICKKLMKCVTGVDRPLQSHEMYMMCYDYNIQSYGGGIGLIDFFNNTLKNTPCKEDCKYPNICDECLKRKCPDCDGFKLVDV